ncbi:prepilin-type N-terminal cleavage/methylation domain-containing protein [Cardiobacteriales bacterium ML27]|uniref:Prepilin-type N-terminal cleavage/methylation domain-containing protein n=1 Tax=Ostreibacterium oceani TaxID=2654998 RepID=A0A6N7ES29_9GAMM|nr:prepilin-type N-terminal cleavage/methylation domain-containing protein [Ostreibacterium oceani]
MRQRSQGFTLIETLVALAIFTLLIAALTTVNQTGINTLMTSESRTIATRALNNIVLEFQQNRLTSGQSDEKQLGAGQLAGVGQYSGTYRMSHYQYRWDILIEPSQNQLTQVLQATLTDTQSGQVVARVRRIQ